MINRTIKDTTLEKLKIRLNAKYIAWHTGPELSRAMLRDIYERQEPHISISKLSILTCLNERTLNKILYGKKTDNIRYKQIIKICIVLDVCYFEIIRILEAAGFNLKYPPVKDGAIIDTILEYREEQTVKMDLLTFDHYVVELGGTSIFSKKF